MLFSFRLPIIQHLMTGKNPEYSSNFFSNLYLTVLLPRWQENFFREMMKFLWLTERQSDSMIKENRNVSVSEKST